MTRLLQNLGYEVMPFKATEDAVLRHVPVSVPLTVTTTEAKGLEPTIDLAVRLRQHGYDVAPHLAARLVTDAGHLSRIVERLRTEGVGRVFVIGGDAVTPAGRYTDAHLLLKELQTIGHHFRDVGIGGYPEGHGSIPRSVIDEAIHAKSAYATRIVTQICFDPRATTAWAAGLAAAGPALPVHAGLPGPVNRQKLIRISASIGLGPSARFLHKQRGWWRFLVPGAYDPTRLLRGLAATGDSTNAPIQGLHIFTFNELEGAEAWRQRLLARYGVA
jgi:methylenetetrahydrofolate reductase (NADPH)